MADTMLRPGTAPDRERGRSVDRPARVPGAKPRLLVGFAVAVWTAVLGVAGLLCLTLAAWVTATHHSAGVRPALATAIQAWLLAQHTGLSMTGGSFAIVPIGLTALLGLLLVRGGRHAARLSGASDRYDCLATALAVALPYAVLAALLTRPAQWGQVRPVPLEALAGAFVLAFGCVGVGALRETGEWAALVAAVPLVVRRVVRAALAAVLVVVAAGAVLVAVGLATHLRRAEAFTTSLHGGIAAAVVMVAISIVYLPNVIVWAAALSVGPGFAVGTHTSVALAGVHLGAVPALPLLAPLPNDGTMPKLVWLVIAAPIGAGLVAGWLLGRTPPADGLVHELAHGFAAGAGAGVVLAVLAWLSAGSLAPGRMSQLGPSPWQVGLVAAFEIGVIAAGVAWSVAWQRARRVTSDQSEAAAALGAAAD
jgi:Family of unknown function (DUF6350)